MIWGFWLTVSAFCALNTPTHGNVWVGGFADKQSCEQVQQITAPKARCEYRMGQ